MYFCWQSQEYHLCDKDRGGGGVWESWKHWLGGLIGALVKKMRFILLGVFGYKRTSLLTTATSFALEVSIGSQLSISSLAVFIHTTLASHLYLPVCAKS